MKILSQFNPLQPEPDTRFVAVAVATIVNLAVGLVYGLLTQNMPAVLGLFALNVALVGSRRSRWLIFIMAAQYGYWLLLFFVF